MRARYRSRRRGRSGSGGDGGGDLFSKQLPEVVKQAFAMGKEAPAMTLPPVVERELPGTDVPGTTGTELEEVPAASVIEVPSALPESVELPKIPAPGTAETIPDPQPRSRARQPKRSEDSPTNPPSTGWGQTVEGKPQIEPGMPSSTDTRNPAEPLPARMLNEFVYCPRLFYYEHVEGVFVDNADTVRGAAVHSRVDKGSGAMPAVDAEQGKVVSDGSAEEQRKTITEPETIHSRSVTLGSERLGVIAKLDLVEIGVTPVEEENAAAVSIDDVNADAGERPELLSRLKVCPVDYKAGKPREGDDGSELWPTDKMQLGLQMLILRDNGYACERGIIYYRATKQRVPHEFTPELEAWVREQIDAARRTMAGPIPAPLVASPKCVRCSLNSVCLPDETRLLAGVVENGESVIGRAVLASPLGIPPTVMPPRRLIAPRDDTRVLYLNKPGLRVGRKDELLVVKEESKTLEEIRIGDLTHVALFGNIQISTQAIQVLCEKEVPVTYFSMGGWFYGITRGHELKNVFTRIEQFRLAQDPAVCLALARRMVNGKVRNHRTMLMRLHLEPPAPIVAKLKTMADSALQAQSLDELLGTEGAAAHFYFSAFAGMLKSEDEFVAGDPAPGPQLRFNFAGRNRRPPTDPVNALLSLAYSLLAKDCTLAAMAVGLDPYVGFYHQPRFGRPALALDVMEEFRPLIAESAVLTAINNRMILPKHFVRAGQAVNLSAVGRKFFFQAYEQRMNSLITHPIFDYKVSYRRVLELQFRLLARFLTDEIPEYPPFVTR